MKKILLLLLLITALPCLGRDLPADATNAQVTTSASGATWVQLSDYTCERVTLSTAVVSGTAAAIEVRRGATAAYGFILPANAAKTFRGILNANQLWVRRADQSNTQLTLVYETEAGGQ